MIRIHNNSKRSINSITNDFKIGVMPIIKRNLKKKTLAKTLKDYFTDQMIEEVLLAKPSEFDDVRNTCYKYCLGKGISKKNFNTYLRMIFKYSDFSNKETKPYNAYSLASALNIRVCPYCNIQYAYTVTDGTKKYVRPDFDHFLAQTQHPLFTLSFYNLIPCCQICNSRLKGKKRFSTQKYIHPYFNEFGTDAKFDYTPLDTKSAIGESDNIDVFFDMNPMSTNFIKINHNIEVFRLRERYKFHSDIVSEVVRKFHISNGSYLISLMSAFPNIKNYEELYMIAFGNFYNELDFEKRPLSKLTRDIFDKMKFIY